MQYNKEYMETPKKDKIAFFKSRVGEIMSSEKNFIIMAKVYPDKNGELQVESSFVVDGLSPQEVLDSVLMVLKNSEETAKEAV